MIAAVVNEPFEALLLEAPAALGASLTVKVYNPANAAVILPPTSAGITEPAAGTYRVALTVTPVGTFMVRWEWGATSAEEELTVTATPALVEIDVVVQRVAPVTGAVHVVDGASVYVEKADGSAIAVWTTSAGTTAATLPLTSSNGRVNGWVKGGVLLRYRAVHPSLNPAIVWEYFVSPFVLGQAL